jgi:hypothetical protein
MSALFNKQSQLGALPFEIPRTVMRTDLGSKILELDHVEGRTIEMITDTLADENALSVRATYQSKLAEMKTFLESNFKANLSLRPEGELIGSVQIPTETGSPRTVEVFIHPENILSQVPSGKMVLIDPH